MNIKKIEKFTMGTIHLSKTEIQTIINYLEFAPNQNKILINKFKIAENSCAEPFFEKP